MHGVLFLLSELHVPSGGHTVAHIEEYTMIVGRSAALLLAPPVAQAW